jgi:hypothetical protein
MYVATLIPDTKTLVYQKPTAVMSYPYDSDKDGPMYNVQTKQISLTVTMNHKMYVRRGQNDYALYEAKDIIQKPCNYIKNCDNYTPVVSEEIHISTDNTYTFRMYDPEDNTLVYEFPLDSWIILFGIWLAEGSCYYREDTGSYRVDIASNKKRVKDALDNVEIEFKKKPNLKNKNSKSDTFRFYKGTEHYSICDKKIAKWFKHYEMDHASEKFIPSWSLSLNMEQARKLIHGLVLGDGLMAIIENDKHNDQETTDGLNDSFQRYYTTSLQLRDDFQQLCLQAGYSANYVIKQEKGNVRHFDGHDAVLANDYWSISFIKSQNRPEVNKKKKLVNEQVTYKGSVFCCTVPSGIIYVRKDGIPCWSGQSRAAQKGSLGLTLKQEDMPFTSSGIVPDIIMNPHAIPSRMTIGHLIEMLMSKICAETGLEGDATPFVEDGHDKVAQMTKILEELGLNKYGYEELTNGFTGEKIPSLIFMGPIYYQRLKHMVADKVHSRNRGPVTKLTRQPLEGRSRHGGLRLGEMERDVICCHSASNLLLDRLLYNSDVFRVHVCDLCGLFAQADIESKRYICKCVKPFNRTRISQVFIPYACKLLFQELMAMNISPRLLLGN